MEDDWKEAAYSYVFLESIRDWLLQVQPKKDKVHYHRFSSLWGYLCVPDRADLQGLSSSDQDSFVGICGRRSRLLVCAPGVLQEE